jgi:HK97 family phage portal protein
MFESISKIFGSGQPATVEQVERIEPELNTLPAIKNDAENISITDIDRMTELFGIMPSIAGPVVTPKTSMKVAIVFACVRLIAGAIAQMPVHVYSTNKNGDRERDSGNKIASLFNLQPTTMWSAAVFWEYIATCMLLHGDGFAIIMRDRFGNPEEFLPISPTETEVDEVNGRLVYYTIINGQYRGFDQDDILHFPGFGFNGERSLSVIRWGAVNSIGLELAMEEHSGAFFKNGTQQKVAVIKTGKWDKEQQDKFRAAWVATYGGNGNNGKPLVLDQSTDIKTLSINAKDSQLLESREFQITDIARAFGLPSFMVNQEQKSTSWGSGISEIGLSFLRFTLRPHLNRFEQEINRKLFLTSDKFAEFLTASLMSMTLKERNEAYRQAIGGSQGPGWMTVNEIRKLENLPALADSRFNLPYDNTQLTQTMEPAQ